MKRFIFLSIFLLPVFATFAAAQTDSTPLPRVLFKFRPVPQLQLIDEIAPSLQGLQLWHGAEIQFAPGFSAEFEAVARYALRTRNATKLERFSIVARWYYRQTGPRRRPAGLYDWYVAARVEENFLEGLSPVPSLAWGRQQQLGKFGYVDFSAEASFYRLYLHSTIQPPRWDSRYNIYLQQRYGLFLSELLFHVPRNEPATTPSQHRVRRADLTRMISVYARERSLGAGSAGALTWERAISALPLTLNYTVDFGLEAYYSSDVIDGRKSVFMYLKPGLGIGFEPRFYYRRDHCCRPKTIFTGPYLAVGYRGGVSGAKPIGRSGELFNVNAFTSYYACWGVQYFLSRHIYFGVRLEAGGVTSRLGNSQSTNVFVSTPVNAGIVF